MQRLEKSVMSTMVPIQVIAVFVLDLCASAMSMLLSEQAVRLLVRSLLIMNGLRWGRNKERLIELALLLRVVTPSVARFPCSRWREVALLLRSGVT
jgi:hypothetical protein